MHQSIFRKWDYCMLAPCTNDKRFCVAVEKSTHQALTKIEKMTLNWRNYWLFSERVNLRTLKHVKPTHKKMGIVYNWRNRRKTFTFSQQMFKSKYNTVRLRWRTVQHRIPRRRRRQHSKTSQRKPWFVRYEK